MEEEGVFDPQRRALLEKATITVGAVGVAGACWPFIDSMNPGADALANATTEVDLSQISVGQTLTVSWQGKPVFITHRTPEQIAEMALSDGGKDPEPDKVRVRQAEWLIVLAVCTHLGCVPNRAEKGWICPCHGSIYDDSGRVLQGPAPRNLDIPPYLFSSDNTLVIGQV